MTPAQLSATARPGTQRQRLHKPIKEGRAAVQEGSLYSSCPDSAEQPIEPKHAVISSKKRHHDGNEHDCHCCALPPVQFLDLLLNIDRNGGFLWAAEQSRRYVEAH